MTTLFAAREALRELKAIENSYNSQILVTRLQIIAAYLESQEPSFDIGSHIPGEPLTGAQFHALYGNKATRNGTFGKLGRTPMASNFGSNEDLNECIKPLENNRDA